MGKLSQIVPFSSNFSVVSYQFHTCVIHVPKCTYGNFSQFPISSHFPPISPHPPPPPPFPPIFPSSPPPHFPHFPPFPPISTHFPPIPPNSSFRHRTGHSRRHLVVGSDLVSGVGSGVSQSVRECWAGDGVGFGPCLAQELCQWSGIEVLGQGRIQSQSPGGRPGPVLVCDTTQPPPPPLPPSFER